MVRPAWLFFVQNVVYASPGRFASLMLKDYGFSKAELGVALSLPFFLSLFVMTPSSLLADSDALGKRRVLQVLNIASCAALQLMASPWLPSGRARFFAVCACFTVSRLAHAPTIPVCDAYALEWLEEHGSLADAGAATEDGLAASRRKLYGRERLWGSVAMGLSSLLLGIAVDRFGYAVFYACSCVGTGLLVYLLSRPVQVADGGAYVAVKPAVDGGGNRVPHSPQGHGTLGSPRHGLRRRSLNSDLEAEAGDFASAGSDRSRVGAAEFLVHLLKDKYTSVLLFATVCESVGRALTGNLVFLYFASHLQATATLCGAALAITVVFEIPLWYFSDSLLRRFRPRTLMLCGMASYVTHATLYTVIDGRHAWWVLCVEPLHGVTYGLVSMATVQEMGSAAPRHLHATGQSYLGVCNVAGLVAGTLAGSHVMERYDAVVAYRLAAGLVAGAAALYAFVTRVPRDGELRSA